MEAFEVVVVVSVAVAAVAVVVSYYCTWVQQIAETEAVVAIAWVDGLDCSAVGHLSWVDYLAMNNLS